MKEVCIEFVDAEVVVYEPSSSVVVTTKPSLEEALAFARVEWPDLGIRVVFSRDVRELLSQSSPKCAHCG